MIQSYDLYSSEQFRNVRTIKTLLENNSTFKLGDDIQDKTTIEAYNTKGFSENVEMTNVAPSADEEKGEKTVEKTNGQ